MYCLHCGDCCLRMSPLNQGRCPIVVQKDTFYFCGDYEHRPAECKNHEYPFARFCPIGMDVLKLEYPDDLERIRQRIDYDNEYLFNMPQHTKGATRC